MKKRLLPALLFVFVFGFSHAQQKSNPKLVVGIVVDQMRAEYLQRFYPQFGNKGFKRLLSDGFQCKNVQYNYIPTYTGPGHASIYSGTTPAYHGIIGNDWYDVGTKKVINCVSDSTEQLVGLTLKSRGASARRLMCTNLADEMKIFSNQQSKVISVSLKDRAAILPAGHMANAAYWFNTDSGSFVSSSYYLKFLPEWVSQFNKGTKQYLRNPWKPLMPESSYPTSQNSTSEFSYPVATFGNVYYSPYGNTILTDFAIETLRNEHFGQGDYTDLLAISYSSPDAVGHTYGPLSKEMNDLYLRLDQEIARLLDALDQNVGKGNYLLFLTADHGVNEVPQYLIDHKVPAGYVNSTALRAEAQKFLNKKLGDEQWIVYEINEQFYLNRPLIEAKGLKLADVQDLLAGFLKDQKGILQVFTAHEMEEEAYTQLLASKLQAGYMHKRSGDVLYTFEPGWNEFMASGSTHGSGYSYDTQIPLIWYGNGIHQGISYEPHQVTDIIQTISLLLGIKSPNACTGKGMLEILK